MSHPCPVLNVKRSGALAFALTMICSGMPVLAEESNASVGRNHAAACAGCHGTNGASVSGIPALAGMPKERLIQSLKDFRTGSRPATIMHRVAMAYNDAQTSLLAGYFAAQKSK